MKTVRCRTTLAALLVAVSSSAARAGTGCSETVIYGNGAPDACDGLRSELQPLDGAQLDARSADDFTLVEATTIGGLHWYTLDTIEFTWSGLVVVEIYSPDGICPDALPLFQPLVSQVVPSDGGTVTRTVVQSPGPFGADRVRYDVSGLEIDLEAGTYFLAVMTVDNAGGVGQSFWETTRCGADGDEIIGCEAAYRCAACFPSTPLWTPGSLAFGDVYDLSFMLTECLAEAGPCPADITGAGGAPDGAVDVNDLLAVLAQWGGSGSADVTGPGGGPPDGVVDVNDLLAVLGAWGPCPASSTGGADEAENAVLVFEGAHAFDSSGATTNPADPVFACGVDVGNDVWFCFAAECSLPVGLSLCDAATGFDTVLEVWATDGPCGTPTDLIACNDNGPGACGAASQITFDAVEGETYKIRIGGAGGATGSGLMEIFCGSGLPNTTCAFAEPISIGGSVVADTTGAGTSAPPISGCPLQLAGGLWYTVVGDGTTLTATTCDPATMFDTQVNVYCGSCVGLGCVASNDDDPSCIVNFVGESTVSWCSAVDETYYILVHGATADDEGMYGFAVTSDNVACDPPTPCQTGCLTFPGDCIPENPLFACPADGDDPALDPNAGCLASPPSFGAIASGETVCGEASTFTFDIDGDGDLDNLRDIDQYLFTVPAGGCTVTLTCEAEFTALYGIVTGVSPCTVPEFIAVDFTSGECEAGQSVTTFLPEGTYAAHCSFTAFSGLPCGVGNEYTLTLGCQ